MSCLLQSLEEHNKCSCVKVCSCPLGGKMGVGNRGQSWNGAVLPWMPWNGNVDKPIMFIFKKNPSYFNVQ